MIPAKNVCLLLDYHNQYSIHGFYNTFDFPIYLFTALNKIITYFKQDLAVISTETISFFALFKKCFFTFRGCLHQILSRAK